MGFFDDISDTVDKAKDTVDDTVDKAQDAVDTVTGGGSSDSDSSDTSDSSSSARDTSDSTGSRSSSSSSSSSSSRSRSSSSSSSSSPSDDSSGVVDAVSSTVDDAVGGGLTGDRDTNVVDKAKETVENASEPEPEPDIKDRIDDAVGGGLTGDRSTSIGDNKVKDRIDDAVGGGLTGDKDTNVAQEAAQDIKSDLVRGADRARVKRAKDRKPVEVTPDDIDTPDPITDREKLNKPWNISASDPVERQQQLREKAADRFTGATVTGLNFSPQQIDVRKTDQGGLRPTLSESARGEIKRFRREKQDQQIREKVASEYGKSYPLADISAEDVVVGEDSVSLSDEGKSEIRDERLRDLDAKIDLEAGEDLKRGEDYTVAEKDGELVANLTLGHRMENMTTVDQSPDTGKSASEPAEKTQQSWGQVSELPDQPPSNFDSSASGSTTWGYTDQAREIKARQEAQEPGLGSGAAKSITPHAGMSLGAEGLSARGKREEIFAERAGSGWESLTSAEAPSLKEIGAMNFQAAEIVERQVMGAGQSAGEAVDTASEATVDIQQFTASPITKGPKETLDRTKETASKIQSGEFGDVLSSLGGDGSGPSIGKEKVSQVPGNVVEGVAGGAAMGLGALGQSQTTVISDIVGDATVKRRRLNQPNIDVPEEVGPETSKDEFRKEVASRNQGIGPGDIEASKTDDGYTLETSTSELVASQYSDIESDDIQFEDGQPVAYTTGQGGQTPSEIQGVAGSVKEMGSSHVEMATERPASTAVLLGAPLVKSGTGFVRGFKSASPRSTIWLQDYSTGRSSFDDALSSEKIGKFAKSDRGQADMVGLGKKKGSSETKITAEDLNVPRSETSSSVVKRNVPRASKAKREIFSRQFSSEKPSKTSYKTETTPISEKISPRSPISKSANVGGRTASQGIKQRLRSAPPSSSTSSITSSTTQARATTTSPTLGFDMPMGAESGVIGALDQATRIESLVEDESPPGTLEDTTVPGKPETATATSVGPLARSDAKASTSVSKSASDAIVAQSLLSADLGPELGAEATMPSIDAKTSTRPSLDARQATSPDVMQRSKSESQLRIDQRAKASAKPGSDTMVAQDEMAMSDMVGKQGLMGSAISRSVQRTGETEKTPTEDDWPVTPPFRPPTKPPTEPTNPPEWPRPPRKPPEEEERSQTGMPSFDADPTEAQPSEPDDAIGPGWFNEFVAGQAGVSRESPGVDVLEGQPQTAEWSGTLPVEGELGESSEEFDEALGFFSGEGIGVGFGDGGDDEDSSGWFNTDSNGDTEGWF